MAGGKKLVSIGLGYPGAILEDSVARSPTVFAAFDYVLPDKIFGNWLSIGAGAGWTQLAVKNEGPQIIYNFMLVSARLAYHFDTGKDKPGVYLLITNNFNYGFTGAAYENNLVWQTAFGFGVKYFFIPRTGVFGETAWSINTANNSGPGAFNASLGAVLKF